MRDTLLDYIQGVNLGSYNLSRNLPRPENGQGLHLRNPKTIYVDNPEILVSPLIQTLGGPQISVEETTLSVVFSNDSKTVPANYASMIESIIQGKDQNYGTQFNNRRVTVTVDFVNDLQVTTIEFSFTKIR